MNVLRRIVLSIALSLLVMCCIPVSAQAKRATVKNVFGSVPLISHAAGGIAGESYTNSKDAFRLSLRNKYNVIEMDFALTSDSHLVCTHTKKEAAAVTLKQWEKYHVNGCYKSMNYLQVIDAMAAYPNLYIVVDLKNNAALDDVRKCYQLLFSAAKAKGGDALAKRLIPQIYSESMFSIVQEIYPSDFVIYTMYKMPNFSYEEVAEFIKNNPAIKIMTIPEKYLNKEGITYIHENTTAKVFTHTINTMKRIRTLRTMGVDGFYTDFVTPRMYARG